MSKYSHTGGLGLQHRNLVGTQTFSPQHMAFQMIQSTWVPTLGIPKTLKARSRVLRSKVWAFTSDKFKFDT